MALYEDWSRACVCVSSPRRGHHPGLRIIGQYACFIRQRKSQPVCSIGKLNQFAYLPARGTADALDVAVLRCQCVRALLQSQVRARHHTREQCCGGLALSVDMAKAQDFDRVPWRWLARGLRECHVDEALVQLVLEIHNQVCIQLAMATRMTTVDIRRGLRHGCTLGPTLYFVYKNVIVNLLKQCLQVNLDA